MNKSIFTAQTLMYCTTFTLILKIYKNNLKNLDKKSCAFVDIYWYLQTVSEFHNF